MSSITLAHLPLPKVPEFLSADVPLMTAWNSINVWYQQIVYSEGEKRTLLSQACFILMACRFMNLRVDKMAKEGAVAKSAAGRFVLKMKAVSDEMQKSRLLLTGHVLSRSFIVFGLFSSQNSLHGKAKAGKSSKEEIKRSVPQDDGSDEIAVSTPKKKREVTGVAKRLGLGMAKFGTGHYVLYDPTKDNRGEPIDHVHLSFERYDG